MKKAILADPPESERAKGLWLNHAVGYTLVRDVRDYARDQMASNLSAESQQAAQKAIDDALYGLMMVLDGVPASFHNDQYAVALESEIVLYHRDEAVIRSNFFEGFCMGYHGWVEGDFGEVPIMVAEKS